MNTEHASFILGLIKDPIFLFFVMIFVQLMSVFGQWWEARQNGSTMTFLELLSYWPQLMSGLGMSVTAFYGLIESNTLNIASAIGIAGIVNKMADVINTRRTKAITDSIPDGTDHGARK